MIYIIPDVHGRNFWKNLPKIGQFDKVVFLGDYLNAFPKDGISKRTVIENFKEILAFKNQFPANVTLLVGDCEISYLNSNIPRYFFDFPNESEIKQLLLENKAKFEVVYERLIMGRTYLFSHAGFMPGWFKSHALLSSSDMVYVDKPCNVADYMHYMWTFNTEYLMTLMNDTSLFSGGFDPYSSCILADLEEFRSVSAFNTQALIPGCYQIFGHSQVTRPLITAFYACVDCAKILTLNDEGVIGVLKDT